MINNDTEFVSALKLKIVEDNLSTMTFNDFIEHCKGKEYNREPYQDKSQEGTIDDLLKDLGSD